MRTISLTSILLLTYLTADCSRGVSSFTNNPTTTPPDFWEAKNDDKENLEIPKPPRPNSLYPQKAKSELQLSFSNPEKQFHSVLTITFRCRASTSFYGGTTKQVDAGKTNLDHDNKDDQG
jgi:hypothetical protein